MPVPWMVWVFVVFCSVPCPSLSAFPFEFIGFFCVWKHKWLEYRYCRWFVFFCRNLPEPYDMSCSHILGPDRSRKLSCRHFRGFMLLKDLKKLKGRERVTPDKALVLYPAWCTGKRRGVKPDCIPGEESQPRKRQFLLHPGTRVWQPSTKKPDGSR